MFFFLFCVLSHFDPLPASAAKVSLAILDSPNPHLVKVSSV